MKTTVVEAPKGKFTEFVSWNVLLAVGAMSFWAHARPGRSVRIEEHGIGQLNEHGYYYRTEWLVRFTGLCDYSGEIEAWECTEDHFLIAACRIVDTLSDLGEKMFPDGQWSAVSATLGTQITETESVRSTEPAC